MEKELLRVHAYAKQQLAQYGLDQDWSVCWAEQLEDNAGGGGATRAFTKCIVFSAAHLAMSSPAARQDAVLHEVAHAIVGPAVGHSAVWRDKAIELGGSGEESQALPPEDYPWHGFCAGGHPVTSITAPGPAGLLCEDDSHETPVKVTGPRLNIKSKARDAAVRKMAKQYPEPIGTATFAVGDTIYIVPFGDPTLDNAPATITKVGKRSYEITVDGRPDGISLDFAGAAAEPT